jgi:hypothetical protein
MLKVFLIPLFYATLFIGSYTHDSEQHSANVSYGRGLILLKSANQVQKSKSFNMIISAQIEFSCFLKDAHKCSPCVGLETQDLTCCRKIEHNYYACTCCNQEWNFVKLYVFPMELTYQESLIVSGILERHVIEFAEFWSEENGVSKNSFLELL